MRALRSFLDGDLQQDCVGHEDGSGERDKMETQVRVSQQRSAVRHLHVEVGRREEGLDTSNVTRSTL